MLVEWRGDHEDSDGTRPQTGGFNRKVRRVSALQWLAQETGVSTDRIRHILNGRTKFVPLSVADDLLSAIGRPDELSELTGRVRVIANPAWDSERWHDYMRSRGC